VRSVRFWNGVGLVGKESDQHRLCTERLKNYRGIKIKKGQGTGDLLHDLKETVGAAGILTMRTVWWVSVNACRGADKKNQGEK